MTDTKSKDHSDSNLSTEHAADETAHEERAIEERETEENDLPIEEELDSDELLLDDEHLAAAEYDEESEVEVVEPEPVPTTFSAKVAYAIKKGARVIYDIYDQNFGDTAKREAEEAKRGKRKVDQSISGLKAAQKKRMSRAVGTITSRPISSTRGNPTRQKRVVVTSKTYKPNLDRF